MAPPRKIREGRRGRFHKGVVERDRHDELHECLDGATRHKVSLGMKEEARQRRGERHVWNSAA